MKNERAKGAIIHGEGGESMRASAKNGVLPAMYIQL